MERYRINKAWIVVVILTIFLFSESNCHALTQNQTWPLRTFPGNMDFPLTSEFLRLGTLLSGQMVSAHDPRYPNMTLTWNLRVITSPILIVLPHTVEDIQRTVLFARQFNLHVSIRSSGHSFIGRSGHDGSININLAEMNDIDINLKSTRNPAGEVTVQSGASWISVYKEVNQALGPNATGSGLIGRVVVGGSAHTVAMGGYTQGGGHAPIGRRFGLAVDNLLEATLVAADGRVMTVSADKTIIKELNGTTHQSSDTSLFWAIRGGGGGTWGVVASFTYKLHYAPQRFRQLIMGFPLFGPNGMPAARSDVTTALSAVNKLTEDWGGYVITSMGQIPSTSYMGTFTLFLNHYGNDSSASNKEVDALIQNTKPLYKVDKNVADFLQYEIQAKDGLHGNTYLANSFVKRSSITDSTSLNQFVDFLYDQARNNIGCTLTMIGGKVMESNKRPATPVHPGMRSGIFSASCGVGWNYNPLEDDTHIAEALDMAEKLYPFGYGSYFNEPAEDMPDWKTRFWADDATYNRLLKVKQQYDPDNFFWCHNCVGSDLGYQYGPPFSNGNPGKPAPGKYGNFNYAMNLKLNHNTPDFPFPSNPIIG